jgi:hypothetical protein
MTAEIETLCDQIIAAAMSVYVKGCDDVAMSNITQLRGICQAAAKIKEVMTKEAQNA